MAAVDLPRNIEYKGVTDMVTDTDKAAEAACLEVIFSAFPDHARLGAPPFRRRCASLHVMGIALRNHVPGTYRVCH